MNARPDRVGFVGLGAMGTPMTKSLLGAGFQVAGFDLDGTAVRTLVEHGGHAVPDLSDLARQVEVVVTSLPSAKALRSVLTQLGHAPGEARPRPLVVVDTSTLSIADRALAEDWAREAGVVLVDCPVSGTSAQAWQGDLVAFLSGDDDAALALARPVVAAMTRTTFDVGSYGNGTRMKLIANHLVAVHNLAAAEALLLAQRSGLDLDLVLEAVGQGAGGSRMLSVRGPAMAAEDFDKATMRVETFQKDLRAICELANATNSPVPLLTTSLTFYELAAAQGRLQQDTACLYGVLKTAATPPS